MWNIHSASRGFTDLSSLFHCTIFFLAAEILCKLKRYLWSGAFLENKDFLLAETTPITSERSKFSTPW